MRVLLTGATGAIGAHLVPQLLAAGHTVAGLTRRAGALADSGADEFVADLLNRDAVRRALEDEEFDAVIHQATDLARPPLLYAHMLRTNRLRSEGTSTMIAVARETGATKFVTASVFYGYGFVDHGSVPVDESEPFALLSKAALDDVNLALASNEQQTRAFGGVSLRYGLLYGDAPAPAVASDWNGLLPMLHLADAASAAVRALEKGRRGATYNIADEAPVSFRELQEAAAMAAGRHFPRALPSWVLRTSAPFASELLTRTSIRLSTAKAKRELGWRPQYPTFAAGLGASVLVSEPAST